MRNLVQKYTKDKTGQFAVVSAVFAFPLVLCVGLAVDTASAINKSSSIQTALDSAALAAVIPGNFSDSEREKYAESIFLQNFEKGSPISVKAKSSPGRVDMHATLEKETLFMGLAGKNKIVQKSNSAAIKTAEDVVCIMTLDPSKSGSLTIEKDAIINAPDCSIQINSSSDTALISQGNYAPQAKRICSRGGVMGTLGPNVQANCREVEDPYASIDAPKFADPESCNYGPIVFGNIASFEQIVDVNVTGKTRSPGIYCGGLHIYDSDVTFEPGIYIMQDGPFTIGGSSTVEAKDVTFIFKGEGSYFYTYDEPIVDLRASESGKYAGMVLFQDRKSSTEDVSIIKGSADIKLIGTAYFPTQDLFVGGTGTMGSDSPAMAFIAKNITFTSDITEIVSQREEQFEMFKSLLAMISDWKSGSYNYGSTTNYSNMTWSTTTSITETESPSTESKTFTTTILTSLESHNNAGLPPVLPRSDGGARLVSANEPDLPYCGDDNCNDG